MAKTALVLYGATDLGPPHFSSDILWRTRFKAPDPFPLIEIDGRTFMLLSALELARGAREARADVVLSSEHYIYKSDEKSAAGGIAVFLREHGIQEVIMPSEIPAEIYKVLHRHFPVSLKKPPFYAERARKRQDELREISAACAAADHAITRARALLAAAALQGQKVMYEGKPLTAEVIRRAIDQSLFADGCLGIDTIVASGIQAADPHCRGDGPIPAGAPIVIDVFPVSLRSHYYADETRTFFKGEPVPEMRVMYEVVREAQVRAIARVEGGADGSFLHRDTEAFFAARGYPTQYVNRPFEGFIHGLGHGVGVDIHEPPHLGRRSEFLEEGNVITIEPGLYYTQDRDYIAAGGIRIEDTLVVQKGGRSLLTVSPRDLSYAIVP